MGKRFNKYQRCANALKEVLDKYDNGETCKSDMELTQMLLNSGFNSYEHDEYVKVSEEAGEELMGMLPNLQVRIEFNLLDACGFSNIFLGCTLKHSIDGGYFFGTNEKTRLALEWAYKFLSHQ